MYDSLTDMVHDVSWYMMYQFSSVVLLLAVVTSVNKPVCIHTIIHVHCTWSLL